MADPAIDPLLAVLAIGATIATAAGGLIAVVTKEWRSASAALVKALQDSLAREREHATDELSRERARTDAAVADRRSAEQRLQFISETMKVQADAAERAVAIAEKLFERELRDPRSRTRAGDLSHG